MPDRFARGMTRMSRMVSDTLCRLRRPVRLQPDLRFLPRRCNSTTCTLRHHRRSRAITCRRFARSPLRPRREARHAFRMSACRVGMDEALAEGMSVPADREMPAAPPGRRAATANRLSRSAHAPFAILFPRTSTRVPEPDQSRARGRQAGWAHGPSAALRTCARAPAFPAASHAHRRRRTRMPSARSQWLAIER